MTKIRTYQLDERLLAEMRQADARQIEVVSARELSQTHKDRLSQIIRGRFKLNGEIRYAVRTDLIGGICVRIGDLVLDGSLRNRITQIKEMLENEGATVI